MLVALYGVYELIRGIRHVDLSAATANAAQIVRIERYLHVFSELDLQHLTQRVPLLPDVLALLYPTLHVVGTLGILIWVYRSRRPAYPFVRTALVVMTALALVGYLAYPVAPPRLSVAGFMDIVSRESPLDLGSKLLGRFYNPVAAVPSLHFAYALLFGGTLILTARHLLVRIAGGVLPALTLLVIVSTGNHFYFDAFTGGVVAVVGLLVARRACRIAPTPTAP